MLKLADIRKTTRRSSTEGVRNVHPKLMRDRSLAPRIELAIRYLEGMLGRPRRELDQEVVVQLFGDHKLARCIVACLATSYRHRARTFGEILAAPAVEALAARGIAGSSELRLWLYRRANHVLPGFVGGPERVPFLRDAGEELGLTLDQIETLITLDAPANAILARSGPIPSADDIIARFNYDVIAALLANASLVRLSLQRSPHAAEQIRELCARMDVRAALSGRELVLHGRQDALNGWARHGARLVRLLSSLLACGLTARSGEAAIVAPTGDEWHLRLDEEMLGYLGAASTRDEALFATETLLAGWGEADAIATDFSAVRRAGNAGGWRLRRATEPLVMDGAVVPAIFVCLRGEHRVPLVPLPANAASRARLRTVAQRYPLVALQLAADTLPALTSAEQLPHLTFTRRSHTDDPQNAGTEALPALLQRAVAGVERRADEARLEAVCEEARQSGVVTEPKLAKQLGCSEEEVAARFELPVARAVRQSQNLQYVEGFGLCSAEVLTQAQAAAADVATMRENPQVGSAWMLRVLGRKLREVTGASEGIECLIAYLGAA
ncbi:MAG: DUF790 family protein [Ktedonobacterales bacterium]